MASPSLISQTQTAWTGSVTSRVTSSIAVQNGDLILVKATDSGYSAGNAWSVSGTGPVPSSWTNIVDIGKLSSYCEEVMYYGYATATGNITVTVSRSASTSFGAVVEIWRNAQIGNHQGFTTSSGASSMEASFTTNYPGSAVSLLLSDFDNTNVGTPTWTSGVTQEEYLYDTADGYTVGAGYNPNVASAGTATFGVTNWISFNGTIAAAEIAYKAPPGVSVTSVNSGAAIVEGAVSVPFTGTGFASGMTGSIIQSLSGTVDATVTQSNVVYVDTTDGKFDLTMEPAGSQLAFSDSIYTHALQVTVLGNSASGAISGGLKPPAGLLFVTLTSINSTSAYRITATPDLAVNDQLEAAGNSAGTSAAPSGLTLNPDGTFQFASGFASQSFYVRAYDSSTQTWGAYALQTVGSSGSVADSSTSADTLSGRAVFSALISDSSVALDTSDGSTAVIAVSLSDAAASSDRITATAFSTRVAVAPPSLPGGLVGAAYRGAVVATGGLKPYTFSVTAGALPPGVSLSPTGILYGTPTDSGTYSFTVTAADSGSSTGSSSFAVPVSPAAQISSILHTTFLLDQTAWDLVLDNAGNIAIASAPYAIAQDVATQLKTFRGECWYDTTQGVPYWQQVLGGRPPASLVVADLEQQALNVPDVETATATVIGTDSKRQMIGQIIVTDADSNTLPTIQL